MILEILFVLLMLGLYQRLRERAAAPPVQFVPPAPPARVEPTLSIPIPSLHDVLIKGGRDLDRRLPSASSPAEAHFNALKLIAQEMVEAADACVFDEDVVDMQLAMMVHPVARVIAETDEPIMVLKFTMHVHVQSKSGKVFCNFRGD